MVLGFLPASRQGWHLGRSDKDSLAQVSGVWKAGQWGPVSAAAPSRYQHTWMPAGSPSAPVPPPSCLQAAQQSPPDSLTGPHPTSPSGQGAGWALCTAGKGRTEGLRCVPPRGIAPPWHSTAHFYPWKEGGDTFVTLVPGERLILGHFLHALWALGTSTGPKSLVSPS